MADSSPYSRTVLNCELCDKPLKMLSHIVNPVRVGDEWKYICEECFAELYLPKEA